MVSRSKDKCVYWYRIPGYFHTLFPPDNAWKNLGAFPHNGGEKNTLGKMPFNYTLKNVLPLSSRSSWALLVVCIFDVKKRAFRKLQFKN